MGTISIYKSEILRFHGKFLRKLKICKKVNFFDEFCTINMQKWTNFKNKRYKYNRILQDLKKILRFAKW